MPKDFEERRQDAADHLEAERENTRDEISRLKTKRGLKKGQGAPETVIDGLTRRIERAEEYLQKLEDTEPVDLMKDARRKDRSMYR